MDCCTAPLKIILYIINILFWIVGGFLIYVGVHYIQSNDGSLAYHQIWPAVLIFASAGILIFSGVIGCAGTAFEKKSCLGVFLMLLFIAMIIEACAAGIMLSFKQKSSDGFNKFIVKQFKQYGNSSDNSDFNTTDFIDEIQQNLECCGYTNYTDWSNSSYAWESNHTDEAPLSCCKHENFGNCTGNFTESDQLFNKGCEKQIKDAFRIVYDLLAYSALALAILLLIGILIVVWLLYRQRNKPLGYSQLSPDYTEA